MHARTQSSGYGCNDHFYEDDTFQHSWEVIARLLDDPELWDIICDVGLSVYAGVIVLLTRNK